MMDICRVCFETTQGIKAKNLFESRQSILLYHIEQLTGEWLTNEKNAPSYICIYCEQDLKVSVTLRERCIKTQRKLQEKNMCASPIWVTFDEDTIDEISTDDHYIGSELDCFEEEQEVDVKDIIIHEDDSDKLSSDIKVDESLPLDDQSVIDAQCVNTLEKTIPEPPVHITAQKKRKIINWRAVSEEHFKKIKRLVRRRDVICEQCGKRFKNTRNLSLHQIRHAGVKNFSCNVCGSKFYTPHLLKRHKIIHTEVPLFSCDFCDRTFKHSKSKIEHERMHRNDKPYKCDHCDKCFTTLNKRQDHQVVHTRLRRFHCELCDQHFLRRSNLRTHFLSKTHKSKEK